MAEERRLVFEFDDLEDELKKAEKEAKETCQRVKDIVEANIPDKESQS